MSRHLTAVEQIVHGALALPLERRRSYLSRCCAQDGDLLAEVELLLQQAGAETDCPHDNVAPVAASLTTRSTADRAPLPGAMLGPYRVERVLGQGGMGVVYLATDTRLDRVVAIKMIRGVFETPDARDRLLQEARSAAGLAHPNIAMVHDVASDGDTPWLVMEYVCGVTLRTVLRPEGLAESEVMRYAAQIAAALEHAHARFLVHRDIKPENILVTDEGSVKMIDFGLASVAREAATAAAAGLPAAFMGTLAYSAPELLAGGTATTRADVYSVGVVLHEMVTGQHPFARATGAALVAAILRGDEEESETLRRRVGPGLAAVIRRSMARDPAVRYRDGAELAAALAGAAGLPAGGEAAARPWLAILDFQNIERTGDVSWLGTAIAETLTADLGRLESLRVASRSRVQQAVGRLGDPLQDAAASVRLGRDLAVRWIVTGTYQQSGDRVRVTPKLIDADTGDALSAGKVDGRLDDVFDLQDRVVAALLEVLALECGSNDQRTVAFAAAPGLLAYEHYARGRRDLYQMQGKSLGSAIQHFARAVALDPTYALAYSGLGTAHALQFLRTSNPDDVARASEYLERATRLDPQLGEPYPWLVNIRFRQNDLVGALQAGNRGIELQPDLPEAQYFNGGIQYMVAEHPAFDVRRAPAMLAECIRLHRRFHPAWIVLGATAMFLGEHAKAIAVLSEAIRLERDPEIAYRFVGAHTLRGIALVRSGQWDRAQVTLHEASDALDAPDAPAHVYRDTFRTLSACALGDVALRRDTPSRALGHYRDARRIVKDSPRIAGSARLVIRAEAGLAAAYAAAGDHARARRLVDEATGQLESVTGHAGTITFECGLGHLYLGLAVAEARLGNRGRAADLVGRARAGGWRDWHWLQVDPELQPLHAFPVVTRVMEELHQDAPTVHVPLPAGVHLEQQNREALT